MDVKAQLRDALDFLAPLFKTESPTLDDFLKDDPTIVDFKGPFDACSVLNYAGEMAGHYFYIKCNDDKVKDDHMVALLQNTASKLAAKAYHSLRCNATHYMLRTGKTDQKLREFIDSVYHQEKLSPVQKLYLAFQPLEIAEPIAHIIFRRYGSRMLGDFARMGTDEAMRLIKVSVKEAVG